MFVRVVRAPSTHGKNMQHYARVERAFVGVNELTRAKFLLHYCQCSVRGALLWAAVVCFCVHLHSKGLTFSLMLLAYKEYFQ